MTINLSKGTICVERVVRGKLEWLPLVNQHHYKEWNGCFSILINEEK